MALQAVDFERFASEYNDAMRIVLQRARDVQQRIQDELAAGRRITMAFREQISLESRPEQARMAALMFQRLNEMTGYGSVMPTGMSMGQFGESYRQMVEQYHEYRRIVNDILRRMAAGGRRR